MPSIVADETISGYRLAPGRYAVVAEDWSGDMADPRVGAEHRSSLPVRRGEGMVIDAWEGMEVLTLSAGTDLAGSRGRSVAVDGRSLAVFGWIAVVRLADGEPAQARCNPYSSNVDEVAVLDLPQGATLTAFDGGYDVCAPDRVVTIDTRTPGAFSIEGEFVDMADEDVAAAFDYGSDAFNDALDEHGFLVDVSKVRQALRERGVKTVGLPTAGRVYAYYAPVQD